MIIYKEWNKLIEIIKEDNLENLQLKKIYNKKNKFNNISTYNSNKKINNQFNIKIKQKK